MIEKTRRARFLLETPKPFGIRGHRTREIWIRMPLGKALQPAGHAACRGREIT